MYCNNCGARINETPFCPHCGTCINYDADVDLHEPYAVTSPKELLEQMRQANEACKRLESAYEQANQIDSACQRKFNPDSVTKLLSFFGISLMACIFTAGFEIMSNYNVFLALSLTGLVFYLYSRRKKKYKEHEEQWKRKALEAREEADALFQEYVADLEFLPREYWFSGATGYMLEMLETGRARTLNQVLSMCDEMLHRQRMEQTNVQILAQQQQQAKDLRWISFWI